LEQGMWGFERCREKYDAPGALCNPLQGARGRLRRRDPYEEYRVGPVQAFIEGLRTGEVSAHDLDIRRETCCLRIAYERADSQPLRQQLGQDVAADVACGAGDEDAVHKGNCNEGEVAS
jgi:hypothetical protein